MNHRLKILNDLAYIIECVANDYSGEAKTELRNLCELLKDNSIPIEGREALFLQLKEALKFLDDGAKKDAARVLGASNRTLWGEFSQAIKMTTHGHVNKMLEVKERLSKLNSKQLLVLAIFILSTLGWMGIYDYQASGAYIFRINRLTHTVYVANAGGTMWERITEESNAPVLPANQPLSSSDNSP